MSKFTNKLAVAALSLFMGVGAAFAENIITYTATSKVSQKDADKQAMAGVAKQVRTQVKSEFETTMKEDSQGNVSESSKSFKGTYTDVVLKGVKITVGPKSNGVFQSTATLDLDQLTSKLLLDLNTIRTDMKARDSVIRISLQAADYRKVASDMQGLEKLADKYNATLEELSMFQAIPSDMRLENTLAELMDFFENALANLKIETDVTSEAIMVTVSDVMGPIVNFPIVITQDHRDILRDKTDENGELALPLKKVRAKKPTGQVTVLSDINFKYLRKAAVAPQVVEYGSEKMSCAYRLNCSGDALECGALEKFISDAGIPLQDKKDLPELKATISFNDKANGNLVTSKATVVLSYDDAKLTEQPQGIGRDADAAHTKAIGKMNANKIVNAFGRKCKGK